MNTEQQIVIPVAGQQLGQFIMSLLGQRRSIEKSFVTDNLLVRHDWIINLIEIISQRLSQNKHEIVSFK
jgi:hypothetical protein